MAVLGWGPLMQFGIRACVMLIVMTLLAYWPVLSCKFINFDDPTYVTENPRVLEGLTLAGWRWAWTTFDASNWHPVTWLSLQLDAELYGKNPAGFHATNLVLHAANVLLLFGWLRLLTHSQQIALAVAAIFAVHPLHVESVAWVSERKDVLSSFFGLASLWSYTAYVRSSRRSFYLLSCAAYCFSLLAKPMWVTLPMQFLLIDLWPLKRRAANPQIQSIGWTKLILEKVPFALLTILSCLVTLRAQQLALKPWEVVPLETRVGTAVVAYAVYLWKTIYPLSLGLFYPYPASGFGWLSVLLSGLLLIVISVLCVLRVRRNPGLLIGWCWYLGTLVPVIGIVQVGEQAYADRYAYLPHIGLFWALVSEFSSLGSRFQVPIRLRCVGWGFVIVSCVLITRVQCTYWKNSETIWRHTLAVAPNNVVAHNNLGTALTRQGNVKGAIEEFQRAVRLRPDLAQSQFNLGNALQSLGQTELAETHLRTAVELGPTHARAQQALGITLAMRGENTEAIEHLLIAVQGLPDDAGAWQNLASAQLAMDDFLGAITACKRITELQPDRAQGWILLGSAEFESGQIDAAKKHYARSLSIESRWPEAMNNTAWTLATHPSEKTRNGQRSLQLAKRICQATDEAEPQFLETLAAAYAKLNKFDDAISTQQRALSLYASLRLQQHSDSANARLKLYRDHVPFRQEVVKSRTASSP